MADFTVITGLADHQPGAITAKRQLAGDLLADEAAGSRDQQFHFFTAAIHLNEL
jgi:hypothetical protein